MGLAMVQFSCGNRAPRDCEKHIREKIRAGDSFEAARSQLTKCGFQTTMDSKATLDPTEKTLYGDKRVARGIITERTQVTIKLDSANKVQSTQVTESLTGP